MKLLYFFLVLLSIFFSCSKKENRQCECPIIISDSPGIIAPAIMYTGQYEEVGLFRIENWSIHIDCLEKMMVQTCGTKKDTVFFTENWEPLQPSSISWHSFSDSLKNEIISHSDDLAGCFLNRRRSSARWWFVGIKMGCGNPLYFCYLRWKAGAARRSAFLLHICRLLLYICLAA